MKIELLHPTTKEVRKVDVSDKVRLKRAHRAGFVRSDTRQPLAREIMLPGSVLPEVAIQASPAARKLIDERGLDSSEIDGTGSSGGITKRDVEQYLESVEEEDVLDN